MEVYGTAALTNLLRELTSGESETREEARDKLRGLAPNCATELLKALKHNDSSVRLGAVTALEYLDLEAGDIIDALRGALRDSAWPVRAEACWICAERPNVAAKCTQQTINLTRDEMPFVRATASEALIAAWKSHEGLITRTAELLCDPVSHVRATAACQLGEVAATVATALKHLTNSLKDSEYNVRREAIKSFREAVRGLTSLAPRIIAALEDEHFDVRTEAANWLYEVGGGAVSAVPGLIHNLSRSVDWLRDAASGALIQIGQPAVNAVVEILQRGSPHAREAAARILGEVHYVEPPPLADLHNALADPVLAVRIRAAEALHKLSGTVALKVLLEGLAADQGPASAASGALLGRIGGKTVAAEPALVRALGSKHPETCLAAAVALARMRSTNPSFLAKLDEALGSSDAEMRATAIRLLAIACPRDLGRLEVLKTHLTDEDPIVRRACVRALGRLGNDGLPQLFAATLDEDSEVRIEADMALRRIRRKVGRSSERTQQAD